MLTAVAFLLIGLAIPLQTLGDAALLIAWGVAGVLTGRALVIYGLLGGSARLGHRLGIAPWVPSHGSTS